MPHRSTAIYRCAASAYGSATVAVLAVLLILAAVVVYAVTTSSMTKGTPSYERTLKSLGLNAGGTNVLAEGYTDADDDLIADAPTDPAAWRDPEVIRFAYLTTGAVTDAPTKLASLTDKLAEATGKRIEYVQLSNHEAQLRALHQGELDVTGFNTGAVPIAVNVAGFVPVAVPAREGEPAQYRMALIVPKDSPLKSPADVKGTTLAFTRWGSNSGFKAPLVLLRDDFNLLPDRDYDWTFTRSHAVSIQGVAAGTYAVAATASDLIDKAVAHGDIDKGAVSVIYQSEAFPTVALGHAHDLAPTLAQQIADALLSYQPDDAASDALNGATGMAPVNYKDGFALVRRVDNAVGFGHTLPDAPATGSGATATPEEAPADQ